MTTGVAKTFFIFLICIISCGFIFAQNKPVAVKVYEYDKASEKTEIFTERLNFFIKELLASPETTQGYVFLLPENSELIVLFNSVLAKHPKLKNRVESTQLTPAVYEFEKSPDKTEFWLVPKGADLPYQRIICGLCLCPTISIDGNEFIDEKTSVVTFTANVSGGTANSITYNWEVSGGEIVKGQGTPLIEVNIKDPKVKEITATVILNALDGVCPTCNYKSSFTTKIKK